MKVLIVDDEELGRRAIRTMLRSHGDVEIAGECENGKDAIAAIESGSPDLVFLDIQMPEVDGFAVLEALDAARLPRIIFVTAFDRYAVKAFEVHALDYLLKPFDRERFDAALDHARAHWKAEGLLNLIQERTKRVDRFIVRDAQRVFFLAPCDVDWVEAQGNYVVLHAKGANHIFRESISTLEARLDPAQFRRIHRSTIVNLDAIEELHAGFHGDYNVLLHDGTTLRMSHRYRANLAKHSMGGL